MLSASAAAAEIPVAGRVSFAGERVADARVVLLPVADRYESGAAWLLGIPEEAAAESPVAMDGRFRLTAPRPGPWKVRVEAAGYVAAELRLDSLVEGVELPPLELEPAASRTLRVRDAAGKLVVDAGVDVEAPADDGWTAAPRRAAAADGIAILPAGAAEALLVTVTAPGFVRRRLEARGDVDAVLAPGVEHRLRVVDRDGRAVPRALVFLPGEPWPLAATGADGRATVHVAAAEPLVAEILGPGGETAAGRPSRIEAGVEIFVAAAPGAGRTGVGRVAGADERPVAGAEVSLRRAGDAEPRIAFTGPRGLFEVPGLEPGRYRLDVHADGFAPATVPGLSVPPGDGDFDLGVVVLLPGAEIAGRVVDSGGEPIAAVEVYLSNAPRPTLSPPEPDAGAEPRTFSDGSGAFTVADLRPGEAVSLVFSRDGYLGRRLDAVKVPSARSAETEPLEVVLERAARVAGTVAGEDREPVEGARVEIAAASDRLRLSVGAATTDAGGRFEIGGVPLGRLDLGVDADGYLPYRASDLEVGEGRSITGLEVTLARGATIAGRVTGPDGLAVAGAAVQGYPVGERGTFARRRSTSGEDGDYRLEGVAGGTHRVSAEHPDFARGVREIDVEPGVNDLDLELERGAEVRGRVVDRTGGAVAGALVTLDDGAASLRGEPPRGISGSDGGFVLRGVLDGTYTLVADKQGYARGRGRDRFTVAAGAAVSGLLVELEAGTSLSGYLLGLDFDELARVGLAARGPRGLGARSGRVDYQGRYSIDGLAPGRWLVFAEVRGSGRRAEKTVIVEPGVPEIETDLELADGFTLRGRAVRGDEPVPGASVRLTRPLFRSGTAVTDPDGGFVVEGLEAGTYQLSLFDLATGLSHREPVEVLSDRDIVVRVTDAWISGTVRDRDDGRPIAGVQLALQPAAGAPAPGFRGARAESDSNGGFRIDGVPDGSWRLRADKSGYAVAEVTVERTAGASVDGLEIELEPTEGITFEVVLASGRIPAAVELAVYDGAGRAVVHGLFETADNGRVKLDRVPAGTWEMALTAEGSATVYLSVAVPGSPGRLRLPPAGRLTVVVPELAAGEAAAQILLTGPDGRPFRTWGASGRADASHLIVDGQITAGRLLPGTWRVLVGTADGRTWTGSADVAANRVSTLTLD